jgi:hypothetical protein
MEKPIRVSYRGSILLQDPAEPGYIGIKTVSSSAFIYHPASTLEDAKAIVDNTIDSYEVCR